MYFNAKCQLFEQFYKHFFLPAPLAPIQCILHFMGGASVILFFCFIIFLPSKKKPSTFDWAVIYCVSVVCIDLPEAPHRHAAVIFSKEQAGWHFFLCFVAGQLLHLPRTLRPSRPHVPPPLPPCLSFRVCHVHNKRYFCAACGM